MGVQFGEDFIAKKYEILEIGPTEEPIEKPMPAASQFGGSGNEPPPDGKPEQPNESQPGMRRDAGICQLAKPDSGNIGHKKRTAFTKMRGAMRQPVGFSLSKPYVGIFTEEWRKDESEDQNQWLHHSQRRVGCVSFDGLYRPRLGV